MFANFGLKTKFNLLLSIVFLAGILVGGITLWRILNQRAQAEITSQGLILIESMNAVRRYTSGHIQPLLSDRLTTEDEFLAETVPAYSASAVFADFQRREEHANFRYKEAAPNPTNPDHLADSFETELVAFMQQDASLTEISNFRNLDGRRVYYIARPLSVTAESCLYCHSTPENAPASLIAACCESGAISATKDPAIQQLMSEIGRNTGIAFQIRDDIFDYGPADVGKPIGNDIRERKITIPLIAALDNAPFMLRRSINTLMGRPSRLP